VGVSIGEDVFGATKETVLYVSVVKIIDMKHDLSIARSRLDCLSDRLLGPLPEESTERDKTPPRQGVIGQLEEMIDGLRYEISKTIASIDRIHDSGAV